MIKVILDSNFLLVPFQFRIDIFEELNNLLGKAEPIVLSTTLDVATNDAELRKRLRRAGLATIYLRQKSRLVIEGHF